MNVRYVVTLSSQERTELYLLLKGGKAQIRRIKRAQILVASDVGATDQQIATSVSVGTSTVFRTKRRFVEEGLEAALSEEPRPGGERKLSSKEEALLVAVACSSPPRGRSRWTMELLAGRMIRLTGHKGLSRETVRRRLVEKGTEALAEEDVVHSEDRRRIRRENGGRARSLRRARGSCSPGRLLRRDTAAIDRGNASAVCTCARSSCALRLRVPTQWDSQRLHVPRREQTVAPREGDRSPRQRRLRRMHARARRRALPAGRADPRGSRQPIDAPSRRPLRNFPGRRGAKNSAPPRVPLHAEARELAEHGGDRDRRARRAMPRPTHPGQENFEKGDRCLGASAQRRKSADQMAFTLERARTKLGRAYPGHSPAASAVAA